MIEQSVRVHDSPLATGSRRSLAAPVAKPRMLCATDLSQHSQKVLARAVAMANQLDATLTLLHVMTAEQGGHAFPRASERIELQLKSIRPPLRRAPIIRLDAGDFMPRLAAVANETAPDLIVLGSQQRKPLEPLIAATARDLAALVRRSVLIVKRDSQARYGSVLIAAEQSPGFDHVLRTASSLRLLESESVAIIHGFEARYRGPLYASGFDLNASKRNIEQWELAARRRLLQNLDAADVASDHFRLVFVQSRPLREIQREVRRVGPDLLVIATKDHPALDRVMRASVGNDALRNIECDILMVPMP